MNFRMLISTDQLAPRIDDPDWLIIDCRHDLANPAAGREAYLQSHLPGAAFAHLDDNLAGAKTGSNGRHPLPDPESLAGWLASIGANNNSQIVAYDARDNMFAVRLWWLLRWLGHEQVAVLDGGFAKWAAEGRATTAQMSTRAPGNFERAPGVTSVDANFVLTRLDGEGMCLIDARAPERYAGLTEPLDPVAGHIPGALNRFFANNLTSSGEFKSPSLLRTEFNALLGGYDPLEVVHQCGSGVTACHNLLAMEIAGLSGSRLYPGSWSEWCADRGRPVARKT